MITWTSPLCSLFLFTTPTNADREEGTYGKKAEKRVTSDDTSIHTTRKKKQKEKKPLTFA
jgi:hypothetical protein